MELERAGFIKNRPWAFIGMWFFIILSPSSSFVPIMDEYVNEYRMYLPVLAPITLLTMGLYAGLQQAVGKLPLIKKGGRPNQVAIHAFALIIAAAVIALGITTYERNKDYASDIGIWSDNVMKAPNNPRAHSNLGFALMAKDGRSEKASQEFRKAINLYPGMASAHANLGISLAQQEKMEALEEFKMAIQLNPSQVNYANLEAALSGRAKQFYLSGNKAGAIEMLKQVLAINPNNLDANTNLLMLGGK